MISIAAAALLKNTRSRASFYFSLLVHVATSTIPSVLRSPSPINENHTSDKLGFGLPFREASPTLAAARRAYFCQACNSLNLQAKLRGREIPPARIISSRLWRDCDSEVEWALGIHGGAGEIKDVKSIPDRLDALRKILDYGADMLKRGETALDVASAVTVLLEDCIYFNAGRGSVYTHNGTQEMDASIMDGSDLRSGACACVSRMKNPILLARRIMEQTKHVLLVGFVFHTPHGNIEVSTSAKSTDHVSPYVCSVPNQILASEDAGAGRPAADEFGERHGVEAVDPSYFFVKERYDQLLAARARVRPRRAAPLPPPPPSYPTEGRLRPSLCLGGGKSPSLCLGGVESPSLCLGGVESSAAPPAGNPI